MGLLVFPVFERLARFPSKTTGEFLGAYFQELDVAAERIGLAGVTTFAVRRPVPEDFDGHPDELDDILGPCTDWFDPGAGHQAMLALADAIHTQPNAFQLSGAHESVEQELRDLADVLSKASAQNVRFRLDIG